MTVRKWVLKSFSMREFLILTPRYRVYKFMIIRKRRKTEIHSYVWTLKVLPLAVFLSFSSFSGLARLSTSEVSGSILKGYSKKEDHRP